MSLAAKIKTGGNKKERFIEIIYPIFVTDENIGGVQSDRSSTSCIWKVVAQGEKANLDKIHISEKLWDVMQYCALDMSFLLLLYKDISPPVDRKELLSSTQPHNSRSLGVHTQSSPEDHDDYVEDVRGWW